MREREISQLNLHCKKIAKLRAIEGYSVYRKVKIMVNMLQSYFKLNKAGVLFLNHLRILKRAETLGPSKQKASTP